MSNATQSEPPVVFDIPTLGRAVCLGELYDQRSGMFLGVQLYPQDKLREIETNIRHTELTVTLSITHQEKASLLDVNARLSLDVLGGSVKVSGSASYLNDEKSNTKEYAYALALKMRLRERRILFAEEEMGRNVLSIAEKDYINTKLATHFVSSIVYGGRYIVNLVARQTKMSKEEKIEGKLQASFDKLKGAVSLEGSVEAKIKGEFSDMDDKFDLIVHGDVALEKVPVTPKDVLDTFPDAALVITSGGGVPISVRLQPIPPDLYKAGSIDEMDEDVVDTFLGMFSELDDLRSRFVVLRDCAKRLQEFIPELARTTDLVAAEYIQDHRKLLHRLGKFLQEYKRGEKPDDAPLLSDALSLCNRHVQSNDITRKVSVQYPSTLRGLEVELSRFQYFITDIQTVRDSLGKSAKSAIIGSNQNSDKAIANVESSCYLSTIEDVCGAIRTQNKALLFIMTPISGDQSNHNLAILKYLAILRKYATYFEGSVNTVHMFYAENLVDLESRLPNGGTFSALVAPAVFAALVDGNGKLTWDASPPIQLPPSLVDIFPLVHEQASADNIGRLTLDINAAVDSKKSFSIQILAKPNDSPDEKGWKSIVRLEDWDHHPFLSFLGLGGCTAVLEYRRHPFIPESKGVTTGLDKVFMGTFVQDIQHQLWIVYFNGDEIVREPFVKRDIFPHGSRLRIVFDGKDWWDGQLLGLKAFACALGKEEVKNTYLEWQNGQV